MAYTLEFVPVAFERSLGDIRERFPLINEVIYENKTEDTIGLVDRLSDLDEKELERFALNLKSNELDLPLIAFRTRMEEGASDKLDSLLEIRFRKKLFLLNWLILQNNYTNEKLIKSMHNLCSIMSHKYPDDYSLSIFSKIKKWDEDCIHKVIKVLTKEKTNITEFFDKYHFLQKSKFSYTFYVQYFKNATKEMIIADWATFVLAANSYVVKESADIINVYLELFGVSDYSEEITNIILEKYDPIKRYSEFWEYLSKEAEAKFFQWTNLKTIEEHFKKEVKKYSFWSNYLKEMVKVESYNDLDLIFIYFDSCIVVDMGKTEPNAFLYYKESFDIEYERFIELDETQERIWRIFPENVIDVKDSIIEGKRSDIYKFSYEFVGRLYIKEILKTEAVRKKKK